ncbi:hypothetical protein M408DRAFT_237274 [Serendipita vermifera MAFF 305830]|uniref:precorrin-2 dehydrogenase n=1 Tax=Serendipita vermifera MAFF 305830 TaxID=933852 RepID=A0A0C3B4F8_SERVB|nr:hypothetical protein M408DRAFT_237274 [Serendipita vermifera MAFF 305830]
MVYPSIVGGASLLIALPLSHKTTLIIGDGPLAAARATAALQADSKVIVHIPSHTDILSQEIKERGERGELLVVDGNIEDTLDEHGSDIALAFITDTVIGAPNRRDIASATALRATLRKRNILVNVADIPSLCDFTLPACHRFTLSGSSTSTQPTPSSLQVAVTTNGKGCRLAGRIRREIVSRLPENIADAVENVSKLREMAKLLPVAADEDAQPIAECAQVHEDSLPSTPNEPVAQDAHIQNGLESEEDAQKRRMRWVAQISEYWPLDHIAKLDASQRKEVLQQSYSPKYPTPELVEEPPKDHPPSRHDLVLQPSKPQGNIYLLGSGPGHPDLLTVAAHNIFTRKATLVLSDKLVPAEVLALIPSTTTVKIAKKFPGNNEGAQNELMVEAVDAASKGEIVVRLKQGDPMVYGRAGDEILYFRKHGFESTVIPGVSSAIAGPTFANIPVTQRGVAESMILCTGVGRQGKPCRLPGYIRSQTLVLLMGVARLDSLLKTLQDADTELALRDGAPYPRHLPIAVIERASMPDQRVISATLETISAAMTQIGEQRPPGMMVIGWSVLALHGDGDVQVLDDALSQVASEDPVGDLRAKDRLRVERWLEGKDCRVVEGFNGWS